MEVLGECYAEGLLNFPRDIKEAITWYEASIAKGSPRAKCLLGLIYLEGKLDETNTAKGFQLVQESHDEGYVYARDVLEKYQ